jgi:protoporphyrinogen oxidase
MKKYKYLILGAGPSGLALANALVFAGISQSEICVLEQQSVVGGLCRSEMVGGAPLDIGGGHFLDVKRKEVLDFLFRFMPREEWNIYDRVSKIRLRGMEIDHPIEANLWQFPKAAQVDYLESIAQAGCVRNEDMPESFAAWIVWKFGDKIANEYMLPYNRKIWSMDPDLLGTYWLHKLPNVSFRETLMSCLASTSLGSLPAHGVFLYPKKFGYGEVWRRMGEALGNVVVTNCPVEKIDLPSRTVNGHWQGENIISTIPWTLWPSFCDLPPEILNAIKSLKYTSIDIDYHSETLDSSAHWVYEPDESIQHHRLLIRSNFISNSCGYWTETNASRSEETNSVRFHNKFAYPINTIDKQKAIEKILAWGKINGILGLGRWGQWDHMNSDIAVTGSLQMAIKLKNNYI